LSGKLFLNIIWHQHQPLYLDPEDDQLRGPWVRTHGTKDYYDMAAMLEQYPGVHCNINLTSSLIWQLQEYYVERLKPFVDVKKNIVKTKQFLARWKGKTDPWIDLALRPTSHFTSQDLNILIHNPWNALYVTDVMLARFPQYQALKEKVRQHQPLEEQDLREIKFWFFLAYFDPDFLERRVHLPDKSVVDLSDIIMKHADGTYILRRTVTEEDCNRIVAETYKILSNILPVHRKLLYHPPTHKGQIEITTTPFYHPILPLVYDSALAKTSQPDAPFPGRFSYPQDANAQVAKSVGYYRSIFGVRPLGMWPAEGSVAQEIIPCLAENGIMWIATDEQILYRSTPGNLPCYYPYRAGQGNDKSIAVVFRNTSLSDKIGFEYQHLTGEDAANDFVANILGFLPGDGEDDRLLTVILDGENAWEWYKYDNDGKNFLHLLYRKLSTLHEEEKVTSVTMSEYILGNPERKVPSHPIAGMRRIDWLYPGSWINANYDTWIGSPEKNRAWEYLRIVREDLELADVPQPPPDAKIPRVNTKAWFASKAWEEMYAAEGSDWFWWYGTRQNVPGGIAPFENAFMTHLRNVYRYARRAGGTLPERRFDSIVEQRLETDRPEQGTMAQSTASSNAGSG
jgi:alpha-amylase/alpha-mannosidase (GH57 family)